MMCMKLLMNGSEFIFDLAQLMHYKCYRVNFRHGGSNIDSPDLLKKKNSNNKFEKSR